MKAPAELADAVLDPPRRADRTSDVQPLSAAAARFTYAGGARPLSGYTIKRAVGRGGFGEVYYAVSDGGKEVALKLVRRNLDVELRGVAQCLNLKHPHLLGLYDIRTDATGDNWVVMEYVGGPSLEDVIASHPQGLPSAEAVAWLRGVAAGVSYLHESGIVHRDLKPANVFCDADLVKLGDYGLSKFISCSRRSGQTESIGTVHYMAPEIASGRYGREIDIYGLGIMLYEMLTGRVPFEGESVAEVLMKHLTAAPDLSGIAEPFRSILTKALAKDPAQRFASVSELMAALPDLPGATLRAPAVYRATAQHNGSNRNEVGRTQSEAAPMLTTSNLTLWGLASEEPILRFVRRSLAGFGAAWKEQFSTPMKLVIILTALWVLITAGGALMPLALLGGVFYVAYFAFWFTFRLVARNQGHSAHFGAAAVATAPAARMATPAAPVSRAEVAYPAEGTTRRQRWHGRSRPAMIVKSLRQRLAELCGSMVVSALASLVMTLVVFLLRGEQVAPEQFAWVALVSIAGAWGVLIPAKFWEGTDGDAALRRFTMLVVGLLVGAAAWQTQQALTVHLPQEFTTHPLFGDEINPVLSLNPAANLSMLMTYLTYFGFLFLIVRWWRLADPLRATRLSPWAIAVCVTCAMALYMFWPFPQRWDVFPQPWGFLVAAVIAISVQLGSPWEKKPRRARF